MKVLFLCLGNICRSPLAEGAFRRLIEERALTTFQIDSAGTGGWHAGEPPDERSIAIAREHGVDIAMQRARQLRANDYANFDWIVAMDPDNLRTALARRPKGERFDRARVVAIIEFADPPYLRDYAGVPDPYYGGRDGFLEVWRMLTGAMPRFLDYISTEARP